MMGFGMMSRIIPLMFFLVFIAVFIIIIVTIVKLAGGSARNYNSPVLTVFANIVGERADVRNGYTYYYITFQVESGHRMELSVVHTEYGMLAQGDVGRLTFQGDKYMGFERYLEQGQGNGNGPQQLG